MIHRTALDWQSSNWQTLLKQTITDVDTLWRLLSLDPALLPQAQEAAKTFPLRVPYSWLERIEDNNINDPILKQVLPIGSELTSNENFSENPLAEDQYNPLPGVIHKYHGRILLITTGVCAINCRYCFRRSFPYHDNNPSKLDWQNALQYIRNDTSICEVILSGGDPLANNDHQLAWLIEQIAEIPHVERLRIHTRLIIAIPQRVTKELIQLLTATRLQTVIVVHVNHPNEIDTTVKQALKMLRNANIPLLNQSVLLKDINNDPQILEQLSKVLFSNGVMPYYLHLLDKVSGAEEFFLSTEQAQKIYRQLQSRVSGYLLPKLTQENPGHSSKTLIS